MAALDGLKVIDLTRVLAGPFCTMLLGDMGADVVKIEEPGAGDDTRGWAPFIAGWSSYFLGVNRNKRSVAVNIKTGPGAEVLRRLLADADVLVENFRPGTLDRLGFGPLPLASLNPRLIVASVAGYGQTGPRRALAGYDPVLQAEAGLMDVTGAAEGEPARVGVAITDYLAGLFTLSGILLALRDRERTGKGQHVDISLFDSLMSTMTLPAGIFFATGAKPTRMGNQHPSIAPYETFQARDGLVMVCAGNPKLWEQFCAALGRPDLIADARFSTNALRLRERAALVAIVEEVMAAISVDEVIAQFEARGVPCGRVRSIDQALDDPQLLAREMLVRMPHEALGEIVTIGNPIKLSASACVYHRPPPALGEHTEEVLSALGYSSSEINRVAAAESPRHPNSPPLSVSKG
jgi:formyl-CoA transferase/CoA:oxalate CoA-transferase